MPNKETVMEFKANVSLDDVVSLDNKKVQEFQEGLQEDELPDKIVVWIDAIHAMTTENYTTYQAKELRGDSSNKTGVHSWTHPYNKPVLTHHNQRSGEPVGRVLKAEFKNKSSINGKPCIRVKAEITDKDAIEKVLDGRYVTVSIGGRAENAYCSICGQNLLEEGMCEHWPGREYEGETCHVILADLTFIEVSFVNVPADSHAMIVQIDDQSQKDDDKPKSRPQASTESFNFNEGSPPSKGETESTKQGGNRMDLEEKVNTLESRVETKDEKIELLEGKLEDTESKIENLEEQNEDLEEKLEVKEGKLEQKDDKIENLLEEMQELKAKEHEALAQTVVEKKVELGRLPEDKVEEMVEQHVERTTESLKDALEDLKYEESLQAEESEEVEEGEDVDNPGLHNSQESQVEDEDDKKDMDEEVAERLKKLV